MCFKLVIRNNVKNPNMLLSFLSNRLTAIKKMNLAKFLDEPFRYIGVPGIYIPNQNLPAPYRIKNPLAGTANI